jgi:hypothetical protein
LLRFKIQRVATLARARIAMPPTTPPTIAPVLLELPLPPLAADVVGPVVGLGRVGDGVGVGVGVGVTFGVAPEVRKVRPAVCECLLASTALRGEQRMHTPRWFLPV